MKNLSNDEKAKLYDEYVRQSENLQRENSKIKSQFAGNIPVDKQEILDSNNRNIDSIVKKLQDLFR